MTNNDLLRSLRYSLKLNAESIAGLCALGGHEINPIDAIKLLKKEEESGFMVCDGVVMGAFLDGLIVSRRGARGETPDGAKPAAEGLNNNLILRKLRIALELNDDAMLAILAKAGVKLTKPALSAMFRAKEHRNFKPCGDQFLRNFIRGLSLGDQGV